MLFVPLEGAIALAITKAREQDVPVEIKQTSEHSGPQRCIGIRTNEAAVTGETGGCSSLAVHFSVC